MSALAEAMEAWEKATDVPEAFHAAERMHAALVERLGPLGEPDGLGDCACPCYGCRAASHSED